MFALRKPQQEAFDACFDKWTEYKSILVVLPTGVGKTILFSHIAKRFADQNMNVLILAHREELTGQAQDKLRMSVGMESLLEKAESKAFMHFNQGDLFSAGTPRIIVGSVQTMQGKRLKEWDADFFDLIIIDEAHRSLAASYKNILHYFSKAYKLGVTATPDRGDRKTLADIYEEIAYEYTLRQAIKDGFLCPIKARMIPVDIDLSPVKVVGGDYDVGALDCAIEPYLRDVADKMAQHIQDRRTLTFLPLIRTSEAFTDIMNGLGLRWAHVDGNSKDRKQILDDFEKGVYQGLSNSMLLTEGYDNPAISCVTVLRPTKSRPLYAQMVGRGTRLCQGKEDLLILDFLWQSEDHDLCVPASLIAHDKTERNEIQTLIKEANAGGDDEDLLDAESDAQEARERSLREKMEAAKVKSKGKSKTIDPVQFGLWFGNDRIADYVPQQLSDTLEPTEKQIAMLERNGIETAQIDCRGLASEIIDVIFKRRAEGLASAKQVRFLARYGIDGIDMSFDDAGAIITAYADNGWRPVPLSAIDLPSKKQAPKPEPEPAYAPEIEEDDFLF